MSTLQILSYVDDIVSTMIQILLPNVSQEVNTSLLGDLKDLHSEGLYHFLLDRHNPLLTHQRYRMLYLPVVKVNDEKAVRSILVNPHVKRGASYNRLRKFFGDGIFTSADPHTWMQQRSTMLNLFSTTRLYPLTEDVIDLTHQYLDQVVNTTVDLVPLLSQITLKVFCRTMFQIDIDDTAPEIVEPLNIVLSYIANSLEPFTVPWDPAYIEFNANVVKVHTWLKKVLTQLEDSPDSPFTDYVRSHDNQQQKIEMLLSVILGGHETTSRLLLGILYSVYSDPKILGALRQEIDESTTKVREMPYLRSVVKEGLRAYPPVWVVSRESAVDLEVPTSTGESIHIAAGEQILISPLLLQKADDTFDPSRDNSGIMPYLIGHENCAGKNFANFEVPLVIYTMVKNYDMVILDTSVRPYSAGTYRLTDRLYVKIVDRGLQPRQHGGPQESD